MNNVITCSGCNFQSIVVASKVNSKIASKGMSIDCCYRWIQSIENGQIMMTCCVTISNIQRCNIRIQCRYGGIRTCNSNVQCLHTAIGSTYTSYLNIANWANIVIVGQN